jgi:hypothetical protein
MGKRFVGFKSPCFALVTSWLRMSTPDGGRVRGALRSQEQQQQLDAVYATATGGEDPQGEFNYYPPGSASSNGSSRVGGRASGGSPSGDEMPRAYASSASSYSATPTYPPPQYATPSYSHSAQASHPGYFPVSGGYSQPPTRGSSSSLPPATIAGSPLVPRRHAQPLKTPSSWRVPADVPILPQSLHPHEFMTHDTRQIKEALSTTHVPTVSIPRMTGTTDGTLPAKAKDGTPMGPVRALAMPKFVTVGHSDFDRKMTTLRRSHSEALALTMPPHPGPSNPAAAITNGAAALPQLDASAPPPPVAGPSISERIAAYYSPGVRALSDRLDLEGKSLLPIASNNLFGTLPPVEWSNVLDYTLDVSLLNTYLAPELLDEAFRIENAREQQSQPADLEATTSTVNLQDTVREIGTLQRVFFLTLSPS